MVFAIYKREKMP